MPRGDRTGPMGAGPMTGWGRGLCAGFSLPGFTSAGGGFGFRRGGGRGGGPSGGNGWCRRMFSAVPGARHLGFGGASDEEGSLAAQARMLEEKLAAVRERLAALGKDGAK